MGAFSRCFASGLGTETDIRDWDGRLVVSHDVADASAVLLGDLLALRHKHNNRQPLALNIKADGLQRLLRNDLDRAGCELDFVFDMSVPEMLGYIRGGFRVFTRQSEHEPTPVLYEEAAGVWVDCFERMWFTDGTLLAHLGAGKEICLVSPELHGRDPIPFWRALRIMQCVEHPGLMICTDRPKQAAEIFHGND